MNTKSTALLVATMASFLTPFMASSINIALPSIGNDFRANAILLSWIATSYLLSAAMFLVPFGRIADIKGRKRIFVAGISVYTLSSMLSALSGSVETLIAFRFVQGIGGAMIFGTGVAILMSVFPSGERGKVLGINVASVYTGLSLGPVFGGFLTQNFGWRSIFELNVLIGLIILIFTLWKLEGEWAEARGESFDVAGSLIYVVMLASIMYGASDVEYAGFLLIFGLLCFVAFLIHESRTNYPVLDIRLFRHNKVFTLSNLAALLNYSATFAVTFLLSFYLQYIKGLTPQNAGMILISRPAVMAMFSPIAGWFSDRVEPRVVASTGMGIIAFGLAIFSRIDDKTALGYIVLYLMFLGFGSALFSSPNTNAVMSSVERKFYGIASATLGTMRLTGQMLSMLIVMFIFSTHVGRVEITSNLYPQLLTAIKVSFGIFSSLCVAGVFASLARGKIR